MRLLDAKESGRVDSLHWNRTVPSVGTEAPAEGLWTRPSAAFC